MRPALSYNEGMNNTTAIGALVSEISWVEVETRISGGAAALLAVGAACKEHGPHLPMNCDLLQAEWLSRRLAESRNVLVWPAISYGFYPAFTAYPGSISISQETFERLVTEVLAGIAASGARSTLVLNTGISTIEPLERAVRAAGGNNKLAHVYRGARYLATERELCRQPAGGHADEAETSIMLAIAPGLVNMKLAKAWTETSMAPGPFRRDGPGHPNYSPGGVWGDPTLADREKGERLLAAMLEDVTALLAQ